MPRGPSHDRRAAPCRPWQAGLALALVAVLVAGGCSGDIDTSVGDVRGPSINGVSAFVQVLRDSGRKVTARSTLPRANDRGHDVVIVFEDRFGPPGRESAERLRDLVTVPWSVTLVLAFRDADRAIDYYRTIADREDVKPAVRDAARQRLRETRALLRDGLREERPALPPGGAALEPCDRDETEAIDVAIADRPFGDDVRAAWTPGRRLVPGDGARVLWRTGDEPLLVETAAAEPQYAADPALRVLELPATPLLNGGLVDPGNRVLAEDLVARLPPEADVLLVGSTRIGRDTGTDESQGQPSLGRLLRLQPLPWILAHAVAALCLFCWWKAPIFGRPRSTPSTHAQDFGHHVEALAALLARSTRPREGEPDGTGFAEETLAEWRRLSAAAKTAQPAAGRGRRRSRREIGDA